MSEALPTLLRAALHEAVLGVDGVALVVSKTPLRRILDGQQPAESVPTRIGVTLGADAQVDVSLAIAATHAPRDVARAAHDALTARWQQLRADDPQIPPLTHVGVHIVSVVSPAPTT